MEGAKIQKTLANFSTIPYTVPVFKNEKSEAQKYSPMTYEYWTEKLYMALH